MIKSVILQKSTDVKPEPIFNEYLFVVYSYNDLDDIQYDFQFTEGGIVNVISANGKFQSEIQIDNDIYIRKILSGDGITPNNFAYCKTTDNTPLTDDYLITKFLKNG